MKMFLFTFVLILHGNNVWIEVSILLKIAHNNSEKHETAQFVMLFILIIWDTTQKSWFSCSHLRLKESIIQTTILDFFRTIWHIFLTSLLIPIQFCRCHYIKMFFRLQTNYFKYKWWNNKCEYIPSRYSIVVGVDSVKHRLKPFTCFVNIFIWRVSMLLS